MASSDFIDNAISSKVDENAVTDLASALESGLSQPAGLSAPSGDRLAGGPAPARPRDRLSSARCRIRA
jgi:hypothetical protein